MFLVSVYYLCLKRAALHLFKGNHSLMTLNEPIIVNPSIVQPRTKSIQPRI